MNEYKADENYDYEADENFDELRPSSSDEYSDDDYSLESRIAAQNQFYGRWAAEKWILRVYLRRCYRSLLSRVRPVKPVDSTSDDELPF
jgi:hypothetical protein